MGLWGFFGRFGATIVVVATWIGILYLAKDVRDLPDALQAWRALVPIDRETLFIWFSGLLVHVLTWDHARNGPGLSTCAFGQGRSRTRLGEFPSTRQV
jgi:hypothetical protein